MNIVSVLNTCLRMIIENVRLQGESVLVINPAENTQKVKKEF